ncbi:polysaccharide biosynthesis/export family protein [Brevundimonas pondensis]|uniref:Polysaccharide export protein n=1 Tax=Brevundimonas pondensis TaxID=2774189 RepID=A0ABX7SLW5_9CAUL|nr:polysaccharide biosynthesis/export family protein [Brevundimonas pondensis]QTC87315.1 polysaccharide export protein [Brevundimonas pondensis]
MSRHLLTLVLAAAVSACTTLPRDGPANRTITRAANDPQGADFNLLELDYAVSERIRRVPFSMMGSLAPAGASAPVDVIQVGDALAISIYEPGGGLFGGSMALGGAAGAVAAVPTANQALPSTVVDRQGAVSIPFAGQVRVAGMTPNEAQQAIRRALAGKAVNPQVIVGVTGSSANGVTVIGAAKQAGRVPLSLSNDTVIDVIAAAGGVDGPPENVIVTLTRGSNSVKVALTDLYRHPAENIRLQRGDQLNLELKPRRFSSFGALGKVSLSDMPTGDVTLTSALSSLGGLDNNSANARSVLVFRFERPEVADALGVTGPRSERGVPVVYRLNLNDPAGFFTANNFIIQPEDVIYVPRADSAELRKFFEFVQTITRVIYDVRVTGTFGSD